MILEKKPATIEAFEYEGGAESAEALAVWLRARLCNNTVVWVPPVFDDGKELVSDEVRIFSHIDRDRINVVFPNAFVVIGEDYGLYVRSKASLFRDFKEISDGSSSRPV